MMTTALELRTTGGHGHSSNPIGRVFTAFAARWSARRDRRGLRALHDLDAHLLRDLGITREDIGWAMRQPPEVDAGGLLNEITGRSPVPVAAPGRGTALTGGLVIAGAVVTVLALGHGAMAGGTFDCAGLPGHASLRAALVSAVAEETSGLDMQMWATIVDRDGHVCAVASSGSDRGSQWPGSRVISAQKANTANAFSLDGLALSTANLFSAVQPGGSLYGLQFSNPVVTAVAYRGPSQDFGLASDPLVGEAVGGVNVFGGGLGLYDPSGVVGGLGLSGDTSCADHMIAWRVRHNLGLDRLAAAGAGGVSGDESRPDNIVYDIAAGPDGASASGFGHPACINTGDASSLPPVR